MKENVLDVLMYLFQNFIEEDLDTDTDRATMHSELVDAGFASREVHARSTGSTVSSSAATR